MKLIKSSIVEVYGIATLTQEGKVLLQTNPELAAENGITSKIEEIKQVTEEHLFLCEHCEGYYVIKNVKIIRLSDDCVLKETESESAFL